MEVASITTDKLEERKRSQSSNPAGLAASSSSSGGLGFSLAGNRGANAANKNQKNLDSYLAYNIGKI